MLLSYARVSSVRQASEEKISIPDQLRRNRAVAQLRGIDKFSISEYVDPAVSGSVGFTKRPEGGRLWNEMKPGDIVVAAKLDRMFRSACDALTMLERFQEREVKVILLDLSVEPIGETPITEALFGMMAVFAHLERRMINERTTNGRHGKKNRGGHTGGSAPYGWVIQGTGKNALLAPHPEEQKTVAFICERMRRHVPLVKIIYDLTHAGYKTREGRDFWYTQIQRIYDYEVKRKAWGKEAA